MAYLGFGSYLMALDPWVKYIGNKIPQQQLSGNEFIGFYI